MPLPSPQAYDLSRAVSSVLAPASLITMTAILLSGYTGKYGSIAGQLRDLTAEYRKPDVSQARKASLRNQLALFRRRITAMWAASALLSLALLAFVGTVLAVLFDAGGRHLGHFGLGPFGLGILLLGLASVASAVGLELYEIVLARLTTAGELADILGHAGHERPE